MNDSHNKLEAIDGRLERIEVKLDNHLERVSKVEVDVHWIQGHLRIATTIFLAVCGFLGTVLWNLTH